ncbi:PHP domain-containing protein [Paracoccus mutanolyticus]|uniref:hypothetical protein n=1 Tax=Paracoccus mutanolyticus TaxID=1499308 RepID=UPI0011AE7E2C|nr:hypothetical protein [Paracoccus mutanolyticus]
MQLASDRATLAFFQGAFPDAAFWAPHRAMAGAIHRQIDQLADLAQGAGIAMVAIGDVLVHRATGGPWPMC